MGQQSIVKSMSLVDRLFGSIPGPLIKQWGIPGVYIKHQDQQEYNPVTGTYSNYSLASTGRPEVKKERVSVSILPVQLEAEEVKGEVQTTDIKILIAASGLGDYYPRTGDWIEYTTAGVGRTAKIVLPVAYRGSFPVFHSVIARLG